MSAAMQVVIARPPMFDAIDAAFSIAGKPVIFAWGDKIYNPEGAPVSAALQRHEAVHGQRQSGDVEGWWQKYIADSAFRLAEEIPAHQAEFRFWCQRSDADRPVRGFRSKRHFYLNVIAGKLASPLYGSLIGYQDARDILLAPA